MATARRFASEVRRRPGERRSGDPSPWEAAFPVASGRGSPTEVEFELQLKVQAPSIPDMFAHKVT